MNRVYDTTIVDRMVGAVDNVRQRLERATAALEREDVSHAVAGGNAVGAWVSTVDPLAVRYTQDVDILIRRDDLPAMRAALEADGFVYRHVGGLDLFLDMSTGRARDAVHVIFANEFVKAGEPVANPDVQQSQWMGTFNALSLEALVQVKLTANRDKDRAHVRDLIGVGLIDRSWPARFPPVLAERLQSMLDTPGG